MVNTVRQQNICRRTQLLSACSGERFSQNCLSAQQWYSRKFSRWHPTSVDYLLKKTLTVEAIAELNAVIILYMRPSNITPQEYAEPLFAIFCKVTAIYNETNLNDFLIKLVIAFTRRSLRYYQVPNPQVDMTDITFLAELLWFVQTRSAIASIKNHDTYEPEPTNN